MLTNSHFIHRMIAGQPNFDRTLGFILADIGRLLRREFDRRVRGLGVTRTRWLILYHVARREGGTQSELADTLELGKMTVGRHVGRLARAGWIERRDNQEDRRAYRLHLRPKGRRAIARLTPVTEKLREDYFRGLSARRRQALLAGLLHVKRNLLALEAGAK